eukprot:scaffold10.g2492.t1
MRRGVVRRRRACVREEGPRSKPEAPPKRSGQQLVDRASSLLEEAHGALESVRQRQPAGSRYRQADASPAAAPVAGSAPAFVWESELGGEGDGDGLGAASWAAPSSTAAPLRGGITSSSSSGGGGNGSGEAWSNAGLDGWFGGKVDTGPLALKQSLQPGPAPTAAAGLAVLERPEAAQTLEFAPPEAPQSAQPDIFPSHLQLRFQAEAEATAAAAAEPAVAAAAEAAPPEGQWERQSGEEFGPNGYWYRWTEVRGADESGAVQWYERWWEISDWKGMRELGAEKWGCNASGDAWRETWREAIGFDGANSQPMVERSAHKWARNGKGNEWEEKWSESYWSAGRAEKSADKWGREGGEVWHEKWGESYDGAGGCVKYTDRWAERAEEGGLQQWGDKWEERFKGGRGSKQGETWSVSADTNRYNRWWGENHFGDGWVQRFGNSTSGEHWDVTEQSGTTYNPIPHFGYDLALAHSPQLRTVPTLPRDDGGLGGGLASLG